MRNQNPGARGRVTLPSAISAWRMRNVARALVARNCCGRRRGHHQDAVNAWWHEDGGRTRGTH